MKRKIKLISALMVLIIISSVLISCVKLSPQRELELQQWGNEEYKYKAKMYDIGNKDATLVDGTFKMKTTRIKNSDVFLETKDGQYKILANNFQGTLFEMDLNLSNGQEVKQVTYIDLNSKPVLTRAYYKTNTEKDVLIKYTVKTKKNLAYIEKAEYYSKDYSNNKEVKDSYNLTKSQIYIDNATILLMSKSIMNATTQAISFNTINPLNPGKLSNLNASPKALDPKDKFISNKLEQKIKINGEEAEYLLSPSGIGVCDIKLVQKTPPANTPIFTLYVSNGAAKIIGRDGDKINVEQEEKDGKKVNKISFFEQIKYKTEDGKGSIFKNYSIPLKITSTLSDNKFLELELEELNYSFE